MEVFDDKSKLCTACEAILPLDNFYCDKGRRSGLSSRCKKCKKSNNVVSSLPAGTKRCKRCLQVKPKGDFWRNGHDKTKRIGTCSTCSNSDRLSWSSQTDEYRDNVKRRTAKSRHDKPYQHKCDDIWRNFKIDLEDMWNSQVGLCYLCEEPMEMFRKTAENGSLVVCVDHDHERCPGTKSCGKCVRGLCHLSCNLSIGMIGDDSEKMILVANNLRAATARTRNNT